MNKRQIINKTFKDGGYKSGDEILYYCPFCRHHKRKLSVNFSKNVWKCWICEKSGSGFLWLIKRFGGEGLAETWGKLTGEVDFSENIDLLEKLLGTEEKEVEQYMPLPDEFRTLIGQTSLLAIRPKNYLQKRNVSEEDLLRWKIGYSSSGEYSGRVIVPSFDENGNINYFIGRSIDDKTFPKYKNPKINHHNIVFNELLIDWDKPVVLVEGVFDALIAGYNAIPMLGSSLPVKSRLFKKLVEHKCDIWLALDADAKGKEANLAKKLMSYGCNVWSINTHSYKDVGEMNRETFVSYFLDARRITETELLQWRLEGRWV